MLHTALGKLPTVFCVASAVVCSSCGTLPPASKSQTCATSSDTQYHSTVSSLLNLAHPLGSPAGWTSPLPPATNEHRYVEHRFGNGIGECNDLSLDTYLPLLGERITARCLMVIALDRFESLRGAAGREFALRQAQGLLPSAIREDVVRFARADVHERLILMKETREEYMADRDEVERAFADFDRSRTEFDDIPEQALHPRERIAFILMEILSKQPLLELPGISCPPLPEEP